MQEDNNPAQGVLRYGTIDPLEGNEISGGVVAGILIGSIAGTSLLAYGGR
jgi:hypothetical protein